jgi:hypothetical protein
MIFSENRYPLLRIMRAAKKMGWRSTVATIRMQSQVFAMI